MYPSRRAVAKAPDSLQGALEHLDGLMIYSWTCLVGLDHAKSAPQVAQRIDLIHQAVPFASFHPLFEGRQHTIRPDTRFNPRPSVPDLSGPSSLVRHCTRLSSVLSVLHASTFLPPLAPRPLRRFIATMEALTPIRLSLDVQVSLLHVPNLPDHSVPNHPASPVVALPRYVLSLSATDLPVAFQRSSRAYFPHGSRLRHWLAGSPKRHGRNGFVILRTGRSPPVALHPASRRRSYSRLQAVA